MLFLFGLFCFAEDYLELVLDDSGEEQFYSDNIHSVKPDLSADDMYDGTILVKNKGGIPIFEGTFGPRYKRIGMLRGEGKLLPVPETPQFPETDQGIRAKQLWIVLQEMKLKKKAYHAFKRFFVAYRETNLDIGGLNSILVERGDAAPMPWQMLGSELSKVNPIPSREVRQIRETYNKLIEAGYQGPRAEIEQLLGELEKIVQNPPFQ